MLRAIILLGAFLLHSWDTDAFLPNRRAVSRKSSTRISNSEPPAYVPSGLSKEEYEQLRKDEDMKLQSMNFGMWGPRFSPTDVPDGDWMVMPQLWTSGALQNARPNNLQKEKRVVRFIENYTGARHLRILYPLINEDDSFMELALEEGHSITAIGLVPFAVQTMRKRLDSDEANWSAVEMPNGAIFWNHATGRVSFYLGDILADLTSMYGTFDVVYDCNCITALPQETQEPFLHRLKSYLKDDGILFTEEGYEGLDNTNEKKLTFIEEIETDYVGNEDIGIAFVVGESGNGMTIQSIEDNTIASESILRPGMQVLKMNGFNSLNQKAAFAKSAEEGNVGKATFLAQIPPELLQSLRNQSSTSSVSRESTQKTITARIERTSLNDKLGIRLDETDGIFTVLSIRQGSPFMATALGEGMEIVSINGFEVAGKGMGEVGEILKSSVGHIIVEAITDDQDEEILQGSFMAEGNQAPSVHTFRRNFEYVTTVGDVYQSESSQVGVYEFGNILVPRKNRG